MKTLPFLFGSLLVAQAHVRYVDNICFQPSGNAAFIHIPADMRLGLPFTATLLGAEGTDALFAIGLLGEPFLGGPPTPVALEFFTGSIGQPQCLFYVTEFSAVAGIDPAGNSTGSWTIPLNPLLLGAAVWVQGITVGANPLGWAFSMAAECIVLP